MTTTKWGSSIMQTHRHRRLYSTVYMSWADHKRGQHCDVRDIISAGQLCETGRDSYSLSGTLDIISVCYVQILIYMYILYFVILYRYLCPNPNLCVYYRKCSFAEKLQQLLNCSSLQMRIPHTCRASEQAKLSGPLLPCWHEDFTLPLYLVIWQPDTLYYG